MSRSKLILLLGLVLLMTVPTSLALAQTPEAISAQESTTTGTAIISDDIALGDSITIEMIDVPALPSDQAYEGWLVSDDGTPKSLGILSVSRDGEITHKFGALSDGYTGENLIDTYNKVVISIEPVPDDDPAPAAEKPFGHEIPIGAITHIRHLLTNWPAGADKGILTNLNEQLDVAIRHANLAVNSDDIETLRLHLHHVINIVEGEFDSEGEPSPNFDISFGNPGDGVGVLAHALNRKHAGFAAGEAPDDEVIAEHATAVDVDGKNAEDWAIMARDKALEVLEEDSFLLAKINTSGFAGSVGSLLSSAREGFDANRDGTTEAIPGEGGAAQAYVEAQMMATYTLDGPLVPAVAPPAAVGEPILATFAQIALGASLALLGLGGFLVFRGRRSRASA